MTNKPATSSNVAQLISRANLTGLLLDLMEMTAVIHQRRETGWQAKVFLHGGSRREHGNHQTEAHGSVSLTLRFTSSTLHSMLLQSSSRNELAYRQGTSR